MDSGQSGESRENAPTGVPGGTSYRLVALVVAIVFISLGTVLSEALIPSTMPPRGLSGWLAFLTAVLLPVVTFFITIVASVFFENIVNLVKPGITRMDPPRPDGPKKRSRTLFATVLFSVTAVVLWNLVDLENFVKDEEVGGIDVAKYCQSYGFSKADQDFCSWKIDLDAACDWEHRRTDLRMRTGSGPYDGMCVDREKEELGGVGDMSGFCKDRFRILSDVKAAVEDEKTWACRVEIDKNLACSWRYQKASLVARWDGSLWHCYK